MAGKIKVDEKTQKVISAELDVDYTRRLDDAKADGSRVRNLDARVKRTLKSLGIGDSRPLKDADHKKLAAAKDAAALIKDFEEAGFDIRTAHYAYQNLLEEITKKERQAAKDLYAQVATKAAAREKQIQTEIASLEGQVKVLEAELTQLKTQKEKYIAQIKEATKDKSESFRKEMTTIRVGIEQLGTNYSERIWNFDQTKKYMRK